MKSAQLVLSPSAEEDIVEIGEFIARRNPERSVTFVRELREFMQAVADAPGIGRVRDDLAGQPHSIIFRRYPYVVYYEPLPSSGVQILRVLHGARDHKQIFGPD